MSRPTLTPKKPGYTPALPRKNFYSNYPIPDFPLAPHLLEYEFVDKDLERRVFTCKGATDKDGKALEHNESLEWLGDSLLKAPMSSLLFDINPTHDEGMLTSLRAAIENNKLLGRLSIVFGLDKKMRASSHQQYESERVLGGLFEAYVGGKYKDMEKVKGQREAWMMTKEWVDELFAPYAEYYSLVYSGCKPKESIAKVRQKYKLDEPEPEPVTESFIDQIRALLLSDSPPPPTPKATNTVTEPSDKDLVVDPDEPYIDRYTVAIMHKLNLTNNNFSFSTEQGKHVCTIELEDGLLKRYGIKGESKVKGPRAVSKRLSKHMASKVACHEWGLMKDL